MDGYVQPDGATESTQSDCYAEPPPSTAGKMKSDAKTKKEKAKKRERKEKKRTKRSPYEADETALAREQEENERVRRLASAYAAPPGAEPSAEEPSFLPFYSVSSSSGDHSSQQEGDEDRTPPEQAYGQAGDAEGASVYGLCESDGEADPIPDVDASEEARLDSAYCLTEEQREHKKKPEYGYASEGEAYELLSGATERRRRKKPTDDAPTTAYANVEAEGQADVYADVAETPDDQDESDDSGPTWSSDSEDESSYDDSDWSSGEEDQPTSAHSSAQVSTQQACRQWNEEFQRLCEPLQTDDPEDMLKRTYAIYKLFLEFQETASYIGRVIIDEIHIPKQRKTYPPVDAGGQAGGEKFMHNNIFFKFCFDVNGYYGGDEFAMKSAGRELAGLRAYYKFINEKNRRELHVPLMIVIDYKGYRLIATSVLPLGKDTLIYGSADGGRTVYAENRLMNVLMKEAAEYLGIKGHIVGATNPTKIYGPADIEGHLGKDGRFYVLDTARVYPPTPPSSGMRALLVRADKQGEPLTSAKCIETIDLTRSTFESEARQVLVTHAGGQKLDLNQIQKSVLSYMGSVIFYDGSGHMNLIASSIADCEIRGNAILIPAGYQGKHLYNLFRGEFVAEYARTHGKPLSSDAYTGFGRDKMSQHNKEVRDAGNYLIQKKIPEVVQLLKHRFCPHDGSQLTYYMHQCGINMRFLGRLWRDKEVSESNLRTPVLVEMITRSVKAVLRSVMRAAKSEQEVAAAIVKHFNLLLGISDASKVYWVSLIRTQLLFKFDFNLTSDESGAWKLIRSASFHMSLFKRLQAQLGIKFASGFEPDFGSPNPISITHYMGIVPVVNELISESSLTEAMHRAIQRSSLVLNSMLNSDYTGTVPVVPAEARDKMKLRMRKTIAGLLERALGNDNYRVAVARFSVASLLNQLGKHSKALRLIEAIIEDYAELPVEVLILARCLRGDAYLALGRADKAVEDYYNALCIANPLFGEGTSPNEELGHPITLFVLDKLGNAVYKEHGYVALRKLSLQFGILMIKFSPYISAAMQIRTWGVEFPILLGYFAYRIKKYSTGRSGYVKEVSGVLSSNTLGMHSENDSSRNLEKPSEDTVRRAQEFMEKSTHFEMLSSVHHLIGVLRNCEVHQYRDFQFTDNIATGLMMPTALAFGKNIPFLSRPRDEVPWYKEIGPFPEDKFKVKVQSFEVISGESITVDWLFVRPPGGATDAVSLAVTMYPCRDWDPSFFDCWDDEYMAVRKACVGVKPIQRTPVAGNEGRVHLDTTALAPGNYWVALEDENDPFRLRAVTWAMILPSDAAHKRLVEFVATSEMKNDRNIKARVMYHFNDKSVAHVATVGGWPDNLSSARSFVATNDGNLYSWSYNQKVDGLGHSKQDFEMVQNPTPISAVVGRKVVKVAVAAYDYTEMHALALTEEKRVYAWGSNGHGQLGLGTESHEESISLIEALEGEGIVDIACGRKNSKAVTGDGRVLVWGLNEDDQAQFSNQYQKNKYPVELEGFNQRIVAIASGEKSSVALSEQGMVWLWGWNCGFRGTEDTFIRKPALVDCLVSHVIVAVAAGSKFIVLLSDKGQVFCAGSGQDGVLGNGGRQDRCLIHGQREPPKNELPPYVQAVQGHLKNKKVVQISAQDSLCCALTDEGEVYYWGTGHYWPQLALELRENGRGDKRTRIKKVFAGTSGRLYAYIDETSDAMPAFPPPNRVTPRGQALRDKQLQAWKTTFVVDRAELRVGPKGDPLGVNVEWSRADLQHLDRWSIGLYHEHDLGMHYEHGDAGCIKEWPVKGHEKLGTSIHCVAIADLEPSTAYLYLDSDAATNKWNGKIHLDIDFYLQPGTYFLVMKTFDRVTITTPFFLSVPITVREEEPKHEAETKKEAEAEAEVNVNEAEPAARPAEATVVEEAPPPPVTEPQPALPTPVPVSPAMPHLQSTPPLAAVAPMNPMQAITSTYTQMIINLQQSMTSTITSMTASGATPEQVTMVTNQYLQSIQGLQQSMMMAITQMQAQMNPMMMGIPTMNPMMTGQPQQGSPQPSSSQGTNSSLQPPPPQ